MMMMLIVVKLQTESFELGSSDSSTSRPSASMFFTHWVLSMATKAPQIDPTQQAMSKGCRNHTNNFHKRITLKKERTRLRDRKKKVDNRKASLKIQIRIR
jgi:hypothetical protein